MYSTGRPGTRSAPRRKLHRTFARLVQRMREILDPSSHADPKRASRRQPGHAAFSACDSIYVIGMNVAITGATGFIGRAVAEHLRSSGHIVRAISLRGSLAPDALAGANAVINLAGEPVAQRWTASARDKILRSRVEGTQALVASMRAQPPQVLISASAVGYYGSRGDEILIESSPPAQDFLGQVAVAWEEAAQAAEPLGVRVARIRIGVVLG